MKRAVVMRFGSLWTVCSVWFKLASASFSSEYLWSDLTSQLLCLLKPSLDFGGSDGHTLWSLLLQQRLKSLGLLRDSGECYFSNEMSRALRSNIGCFTLADWGAQACNLQMGIGTACFMRMEIYFSCCCGFLLFARGCHLRWHSFIVAKETYV